MQSLSDAGLAARQVSGKFAGCSRRDASANSPFPGIRGPHARHRTSKRMRRQLVQMLSSAAVPGNVRVVTKDSVRVKRILAEVKVQASVEQVWRVLTDYGKLADFVPNLDACERVGGAPPGKHRLRQRACSQSLYWRLQAEAVVDVQEVFRPLGRRELHFELVEGDFQEFAGRWILDPDPGVVDGLELATILRYEVSIVPRWSLPSTLITTIVRCGLPANVQAIALRAEQIAQRRRQAPKFAKAALEDVATPGDWTPRRTEKAEEVLPAKGPARTADIPTLAAQALDAKGRVLKRGAASYLGLSSVPVPFPVPPQPGDRWERVQPDSEQPKSEPQDSPAAVESAPLNAAGCCEVHFRRLDDPLMLHRRVVASITIAAEPEEVWRVLTDYERLPQFIPNLAVCERLETPPGAPERLVRLRQVGYKSMAYMHLHAEAVMAVVESPMKEIQFKQTRGDFQLLQGKFMLQDAVPREAKAWAQRSSTVLKYAVEVEIPRTVSMLGLLEPLLERVVYQDIPANLEAIKRRVECPVALPGEEEEAEQEIPKQTSRSKGRLTTAQLSADFRLLEAELRATFGEAGPLPRRTVLRSMKRYDLEDAIAAHGGAAKVTAQMGWETAFRTRGSPSLPALREELEGFGRAEGLPPGVLPSRKMLLRGERQDLVNRANRWGGLSGVAAMFGCEVANGTPTNQQAFTDEELDGLLRERRPSRTQLAANFGLLAAELQRCFGGGPLPSAVELRAMKREDLAQAVQSHGGPAVVSQRLGWTLDQGLVRQANSGGTAAQSRQVVRDESAGEVDSGSESESELTQDSNGSESRPERKQRRARRSLATDMRKEIDSW